MIYKSVTRNKQKGMSLMEILVVVAIFAVLGVATTRSVITTLQGSKKSESTIKVRENLDYSLGVMERLIRNADSVSACTTSTSTVLNYTDQEGKPASFSCVNIGTNDGYVASGSGRLTSNQINVTECSFRCDASNDPSPASVNITLVAQDAVFVATQTSSVSATTQINLRNY